MEKFEVTGPFPKSDRKDELQSESLKALRNALPSARFRIRDERVEDFGVDCSIELIIDGLNLNMRSQVQIKGTDSLSLNEDGSYSHQIKVSNLNYLLQGTSPIYVVHLNGKSELRYAWAFDESRRLNQELTNWRQQDTVTIRFTKILDEEALEEIKERILRETSFKRQILTDLTAATSVNRLHLSIDPVTYRIENFERNVEILENEGIDLISIGNAGFVLQLFENAASAATKSKPANLAAGYALVVLGRYTEARGHLSRSMSLDGVLSTESAQVLQYASLICDYQLGRISEKELADELRALAESTDS